MRQPSLLPTLFAIGAAAFASMILAPGCGGGSQTTTGSAGSAGTDSTTSTAGSAGSGTTTTTNDRCQKLCDHLAEIQCTVLKDCEADCNNHLNAPADCADEADALIDCWVMNLNDLTCDMKQVLPPAACKDAEAAFNACVNGGAPDASCICSSGVGGGDFVTNCTRTTSCATLTYRESCKQLKDGDPWTCSCFANEGLLGTCTEDANITHCSNDFGCCVPLFCSASGE